MPMSNRVNIQINFVKGVSSLIFFTLFYTAAIDTGSKFTAGFVDTGMASCHRYQ
jgi:hypothetical protein